MSATGATSGRDRDVTTGSHTVDDNRRLSTETKASYKTTEFIAYVAVLAGILIAGAVISGDGGSGDNADFFRAGRVWLYAAILTVGYMISRGLAKAGSRDPYDAG